MSKKKAVDTDDIDAMLAALNAQDATGTPDDLDAMLAALNASPVAKPAAKPAAGFKSAASKPAATPASKPAATPASKPAAAPAFKPAPVPAAAASASSPASKKGPTGPPVPSVAQGKLNPAQIEADLALMLPEHTFGKCKSVKPDEYSNGDTFTTIIFEKAEVEVFRTKKGDYVRAPQLNFTGNTGYRTGDGWGWMGDAIDVVFFGMEHLRVTYPTTGKNIPDLGPTPYSKDLIQRLFWVTFMYDGFDQALRFLKMGADIKPYPMGIRQDEVREGKEGASITHYACENGSIKAVNFVKNNGGLEPNAKDQNGSTPMHYLFQGTVVGAMKDRMAILDVLLAAKADVNAKNTFGNTPLFSLLYTQDLSDDYKLTLMSALLKKAPNVDLNTKGEDDSTALEVCIRADWTPAVSILKEAKKAAAPAKAAAGAKPAAGTGAAGAGGGGNPALAAKVELLTKIVCEIQEILSDNGMATGDLNMMIDELQDM